VIYLKTNKNFKKIVRIVITLLILLGIPLLEVNIDELREDEINLKRPISSGYWELNEVEINGNSGWASASLLDWCHGSGTWVDPYIIENVTFRCLDGSGNSLRIYDSDVYFIIRNCTFTLSGTNSENQDAGLELNRVKNSLIIENYFIMNKQNGLFLTGADGFESRNNTIINNTVKDNVKYGIYLHEGDENTILKNTVLNNSHGIRLHVSLDNTIEENKVQNNSYGFSFQYGHSNQISNNLVTDNRNDGFYVYRSNLNTIRDNIVKNNSRYGIYAFETSINNEIYYNRFENNNLNAFDTSSGNIWDNGSIGNYWDDYKGYDINGDGIGEIPYVIHGGTGGQDNFPIWSVLAPIYIDGTATGIGAHNWTWASNQLWCSGKGTEIDPYIIANEKINGLGSSPIFIENSDVFFIIDNCILFNSTINVNHGGIYLDNCKNGKIYNNRIFNTFAAIHIKSSSNNTVSENNCSSNGRYGIRLESSNNNTFSWNDCSSNDWVGIHLKSSNNDNIFIRNNCSSNGLYGIESDSSNNNDFLENDCSFNGKHGINVYSSSNDNIISGNTANNNTDIGIRIYSSDNNTVSGNSVNINDYGINIAYSYNNTVSGNTANDNQRQGIYLYESDNNTITGSTARNNNYNGIYIDFSDNNSISGNTANNNGYYGIYLRHSDNNDVSGNSVNDNNQGIRIDTFCENNFIGGNTANSNNFGIFIDNSNNNTISRNIVDNNVNYGIYITSSDYNLIYNNYFINNGIQARDLGTNNNWNSSIIGNYWDDYSGVDSNGDGIGDTPYIIPGTAGSQDNFPIYDDKAPLVSIYLPLNGTCIDSRPRINVSAFDPNMDSMWYEINEQQVTINSGVEVLLDDQIWTGLTDGPFIIKIYATDLIGHINDSYSLILYKDTANPIISITNPIEDQEFGVQAPTYDFDIDELCLDAMWYVIISEGSTTHIISSTSGAINESLWDSLDDGEITIRFYANDTLGHEGYAEVIIIKNTSTGPGTPVIIGFDIFTIIAMISLITTIMIWRKKLLNFNK